MTVSSKRVCRTRVAALFNSAARNLAVALTALASCTAPTEASSSALMRIQADSLPLALQEVLGLAPSSVLTIDSHPFHARFNPTDESGGPRLEDGLPVTEDCLALSWTDESGELALSFLVLDEGRKEGLWIRAAVVATLPFGNWKTAWTGMVRLSPDVARRGVTVLCAHR